MYVYLKFGYIYMYKNMVVVLPRILEANVALASVRSLKHKLRTMSWSVTAASEFSPDDIVL